MGKTLTPSQHHRIRDPNRRAVRRTRAGTPARLWLDLGWRQAICEDVSRVGVRLRTFGGADGLPLQAPVRVTLELPRGTTDIRGRLVHRDGDLLGIEFQDLSPASRAMIRRAVPG